MHRFDRVHAVCRLCARRLVFTRRSPAGWSWREAAPMGSTSKIRSQAAQAAVNGVAVLAMVTLLLAPLRHTGYALAGLALAGVAYVAAHVSFAATMPAQIMITAGLLADYQQRLGGPAGGGLIA